MPAPAAVAASTSAAAAPERRRRDGRRRAAALLALGLAVGPRVAPARAAAPAAGHGPVAAAADRSWFSRTLHRYFSNEAPTGAELGGQVVALSERYAAQAGRRIAVVIVQQVDRLRPDDASRGELLSSLARTLRPYTREGVLRQYLLFHQGEPLDPLKLADSERLLREIEYVADVRLHVVPLTGQEDEVAVVVEIRDRLPVGARLAARGLERLEAGLFHANVGGLDLRLGADLRYRTEASPRTGWGGELRKRNMGGSFVDAELGYEDSWRGLDRRATLTRVEAHPDIRWVGGLAWRDRRDREAAPQPLRSASVDGWVGRVFRLRAGQGAGAGSRAVLVPALGLAQVRHRERPATTSFDNPAWHDSRQLLGGLTWSRARDYRTSFLHGLGQTENLSGGQGLKLSAAYVDGEYRDRTGLFLQGWRQVVRGRGDVLNLGLDVGGYLRDGRLEDGSLRLAAHYVSPLLGGGGWRSRLLLGARFHRAVRPTAGEPLTLAGDLGPRDLDLAFPGGDRRLVVDTEWRFYPPWVVSGFRCQAYLFADGGLLAGDGLSLADPPLRGSAGLGLRIGNPDLVLPVLQLQVAFLRAIDDNAPAILFTAGNFSAPETRLPGARPGAYEFR